MNARVVMIAAIGWVLGNIGCVAHPAGTSAGDVVTDTSATIATDDVTCTTFASRGLEEHIARVHIATGEFEIGAKVDADVVADASSIGIQNGKILTCANTVVAIDMIDGSVETSDVACDMVAADANAVWVIADAKLARYATFDAVKAHAVDSSIAAPKANRIAPAADGLLASMYETDRILRVSATTGKQTGVLELAGYEGVILGLAEIGDDRVAIAPWYTEGVLFVFDAKTGAREISLPRPKTGEIFHGLVCN